jgi:hypothetical protein
MKVKKSKKFILVLSMMMRIHGNNIKIFGDKKIFYLEKKILKNPEKIFIALDTPEKPWRKVW